MVASVGGRCRGLRLSQVDDYIKYVNEGRMTSPVEGNGYHRDRFNRQDLSSHQVLPERRPLARENKPSYW